MPPAAPLRSLRVWMNAFIPAHVPGFTTTLAEGQREGWTVFGPPGSERTLLTHQRVFSPATDADSLLHSHVRLAWLGAQPTLEQWHRSQAAQENPAGDADLAEAPAGDVSQMKITLVTERSVAGDPAAAKLIHNAPRRPGQSTAGLVYLIVDCQSAEQGGLYYDWFAAPYYRGLVTFDPAARTVDFSGTVSRFPAFEMYASLNDGPPHPVARASPPRGRDLLTHGPGERPIRDGVKLA